jgi:lysine 2,3-aminomutase
VLDVPGGHGKVPIGPGYLGDDPEVIGPEVIGPEALTVEDAFGEKHRYPPR